MKDKFFNLFDARFILAFSFIVLIVITVLKPFVGGIAGLIYIYLIFISYKNIKDKNYASQRYIEQISQDFDSVTKQAVFNMPFPMVICDGDGTVLWYNTLFVNLFSSELMGENIKNILPQIIREDINETGYYISFDSKDYIVYKNNVDLSTGSSERKSIQMYFMVDSSDYKKLQRVYIDSKAMILKIEVDNYDEALDSTPDSSRPILIAEIDSILNSYFDEYQGLLIKSDSDTYIAVLSFQALKQIKERRFDLLDDLRELDKGNAIPITLSIGVSSFGKSFSESYQEADTALDIALGRGGDQAVVRVDDNYEFFGGRSKAVEKRNKVKARVIGVALRQLIDATDEVFIMGHANPDMDAMGAAIGVHRAVLNRGKKGYIVFNEINPSIENLMIRLKKEEPELLKDFLNSEAALGKIKSNSLIIMVDNHRPSMTECPELIAKTNQIVILDHHRRSKEFVKNPVLTYIEPYASSTCELVTEMLTYMSENSNLTHFEADALMSGIIVDTKNFTFQTGVRTFEAASMLRRQGSDMVKVQALFKNDLDTLQSKAEVVHATKIIDGKIAISKLDRYQENSILIAAQAADELLQINNIEASFVLTHKDNKIHISGRSRGSFSVQLVLEKIGGGGHLNMAGAQVETDSIEEAEKILRKALDEYMKEVENK
ncbi:DHH family phosphoesterase [Peptoniphilus sp. BV3C26]|uniref:DHH family phosphoesterase n=1 Tax=Peptoniphilus sp. BV3C26 TaxID=1111134 RepID=UPI0003B87804|nr:DHH family phosphoesterase [Peptoniphilus sp. BV3C26]ERT57975.1 DHHA1 domain protein [Peptoniphilus sp. BV3C26]